MLFRSHDRIFKLTPGPLACVLCHQGMETHDHLFFKCSFSSFVWQGIMQCLEIGSSPTTWGALVEWAAGYWKKKTPPHIIPRIFFGAAIYHIWKERNARTFRSEAKPEGRILRDICYQVSLQTRIKWRNDPQLPQLLELCGG